MGLRHLIDRQQIPQMRRCQFHAYHTLFIGIFSLSGTAAHCRRGPEMLFKANFYFSKKGRGPICFSTRALRFPQ